MDERAARRGRAGAAGRAAKRSRRGEDPGFRLRPEAGAPARAPSGTTAAVLRAVRDDVGLDRAMELLEGSRRRLDRSAQTDDLDALVALAAAAPRPGRFRGLAPAARSADPGSLDGVVLSTIHRVKGREWPHVVLHEASAGLLPHRLAVDVEEERRVFHVGLTTGLGLGPRRGGRAALALPRRADRAVDARPPAARAGAVGSRPLRATVNDGSVRPVGPCEGRGARGSDPRRARAGGCCRPRVRPRRPPSKGRGCRR